MPEDEEFNYNVCPELNYNQLFCYVDFVKPGKHQYFVNYHNEFEEPAPVLPPKPKEENTNPFWTNTNESLDTETERNKPKDKVPKITQEDIDNFVPRVSPIVMTSYHQFLSQPHLGDYKCNTKVNEFDKLDRKFDKNNSVFKDWKVDNTKKIKDGLSDEIQFWKVPNFVKDENEVEMIKELLIRNAEFLKTYFTI
jgi:hypothetical protein